jgi:hypothetical protein
MNEGQLLPDRGVSRTREDEGGKEDRGGKIGEEKKEKKRCRNGRVK